MDKKDYRLKGHESFTLREGWLTKGLNAVHENPRVFSENSGADALGVGTNMAKSIRYWMRTAELTKEHPRDGVTLTEYGNLIFQNDPYFEDIFSLWVIHANIARNFKLATSWNIFFNNIDVTSFKREELINMMTENIINITGDTMPQSVLLQMIALQFCKCTPKMEMCPLIRKKRESVLLQRWDF